MIELATYNSSEAECELNNLQQKAEAVFPDAKITTVGSIPQFTTMMQYRGHWAKSIHFLIALGIIAVLLMVVFGSIRIGLIGLIPNVAPAIAVGGVMGLLEYTS